MTRELYEDLLDEDAGPDLRGRAIVGFAIDLLKKAFEGLEQPLEEEKLDEETAAEEGSGE